MAQTQFNQKRRLISPRRVLGLVIALGVLAILVSSVSSLYKKHRVIRAHINELKKDQVVLAEKYKSVTDLNERIETTEGREYVLRDKYRMIRPGEGLIVVADQPETVNPKEKTKVLRRFWDSILTGVGIKKD